jgi:hypothetical protein
MSSDRTSLAPRIPSSTNRVVQLNPSIQEGKYMSFREINQDNNGFSSINAIGTRETLKHVQVIVVAITQIKMGGTILFGFSLLSLLQNPHERHEYEPFAKFALGVCIAITFATTTFAMFEAHYLETLSSASQQFLNREKADDDSFQDLDEEYNEDLKLAQRFNVILGDLEKIREIARKSLWFTMMLLVVASFIRLGEKDIIFVAVGCFLVVVTGALLVIPVLRKIRTAYAPLIKEYRGIIEKE